MRKLFISTALAAVLGLTTAPVSSAAVSEPNQQDDGVGAGGQVEGSIGDLEGSVGGSVGADVDIGQEGDGGTDADIKRNQQDDGVSLGGEVGASVGDLDASVGGSVGADVDIQDDEEAQK